MVTEAFRVFINNLFCNRHPLIHPGTTMNTGVKGWAQQPSSCWKECDCGRCVRMRGQVSKSVLMRLLQRRTEYVGVEKESERGRHSGHVFDVETPAHVSPVNNGRTDGCAGPRSLSACLHAALFPLPKECFSSLVNFVIAVAYHFCLNLPATFSQPCTKCHFRTQYQQFYFLPSRHQTVTRLLN